MCVPEMFVEQWRLQTLTFHFMLYWSGPVSQFFSSSSYSSSSPPLRPVKELPPHPTRLDRGHNLAPAVWWLPWRRHPPATLGCAVPKFTAVSDGKGRSQKVFWDSSDATICAEGRFLHAVRIICIHPEPRLLEAV